MLADVPPSRQFAVPWTPRRPACDRPQPNVRGLLVGVASVLALSACKNPFAESAPVEAGGTLSYMITETRADQRESYVLRARVVDTDDGLEVQMQSPLETVRVPVDDRLVPIDEKLFPLEFPLVLTATAARPGLLWLPPDRRREGKEFAGAKTGGVVLHQRWTAWSVVGPDGMPRYYETDTGLLVDFKLLVDEVRVSGQLVSAL